jgi:hypothetical protein
MSGLGYALVALGVGTIVGLVIWIRAGRDAFAKALGAGMTLVGVVPVPHRLAAVGED